MKNKSFYIILVIIFYFSNKAKTQQVSSIPILKKIEYFKLNDSSCFFSDSLKAFIVEKDTLYIKFDDRKNFKGLEINKYSLDSICKGNISFNNKFSDLVIDIKNFKWFKLSSRHYYLISFSLKNCVGSFCTATFYFLIEAQENKTPLTYFFLTQEIPKGFYFKKNNNNKLFFLNHNSFFQNENLFEKYSIKTCEDCFEIVPFILENKKWTSIKPINVIQYYDDFKKNRIIR